MKSVICVVFDRAVNAYGQPFFTGSTNAALRSFSDEVNNAGSPFQAHPDDYDLYYIGEYDPESGAISASTPSIVARGKDVVRAVP